MNKVLKDIFKKHEYFEEVNENVFTPKFLRLVVNGVVVFNVNWVFLTEEELMFINHKNTKSPIASITLSNLNSLLMIDENKIIEIL